MTEAAIDRWFLEYAKPHFMRVLRMQIQAAGEEINPGDDIALRFYEGDPGIVVPPFVTEKLLEDEDF